MPQMPPQTHIITQLIIWLRNWLYLEGITGSLVQWWYNWNTPQCISMLQSSNMTDLFLLWFVRKTNVWLQTKLEEHSFAITALWNQAAAALSPRHTINSPWGAAWSLCLTACSWTPCWAIYFTANIPSAYWSVAPCHTAALPPQDRKASQGLNKPPSAAARVAI